MPLSCFDDTRDASPKLTTKKVELGHVLPVQRSQYVIKDCVKRARSTATSSACHVHVRARAVAKLECCVATFIGFGESREDATLFRGLSHLTSRPRISPHPHGTSSLDPTTGT